MAVLGRLLEPITFGIFALLIAIHSFLFPIVDFGLTPVYIKITKVTQETKNVFFSLNIFLGFLYGFLFLGISFLFEQDGFTRYAFAFILSILFFSFNQQSIANLIREHQQKIIMYIDVISLFLSALLAILLAYLGHGIHALLAQQLAIQILRTLILRVVYPQSYKITNINTIKNYKNDILFSTKILSSRIINGFSLSYDKLLISNFFGLTALGLYSKAFELSRYPNATIGTVIASPILAFLARKPKEEVRDLYPIIGNVIFFLSANILIFLIFYGEWFVVFLLGQQWVSSGIYLQILSLWGIGKVIHGILITLYTNEEMMGIFTAYSIVALLINAAMFILGYFLTRNIVATILFFSISHLVIWASLYFYSLYKFSKLQGLLDGIIFFSFNSIIFSFIIYYFNVSYFDQSEYKPLSALIFYVTGMLITFLFFIITNGKLLLNIRKLKD